MADKVATYAVNLESNAKTVAGGAADELEALRQQIEQSQAAMKGMSGALRSLRGSSDDVAKAKEQLKARLEAERGAVSQANLALLKQGTTYEQLAQKVKAAEAAQKKADAKKQADLAKKEAEELKKLVEQQTRMMKGIQAAGGPVAELTSKFGALKEIVGGAGGGMGLFALATAGAIAGAAAFTATLIDVAFRLGKFILGAADAARNMGLIRQAAAGSAAEAKNLGTWVDFASRRVSTSKERLNELAASITRNLSGGLSRASGKAIGYTFLAVAQASDAAGEEVGRRVQDILESGRRLNRLRLGPEDLDKTGLQFQDIAKALAKNMRVGVADAKAALFEGRVGLEAGARAVRDAIQNRFGEVNAEKLLSADVQLEKLGETFRNFGKGVVLEPLLRTEKEVLKQLAPGTENGRKLQETMVGLGNSIAGISIDALKALPDIIKSATTVFRGGVDFVRAWGPALVGAFNNPIAQLAMKGLVVVGGALVGVMAALGTTFFGAAFAIGAVWTGFVKLGEAAYGAYAFIAKLDWGAIGRGIIDGLVAGLKRGTGAVVDAVKGIGGKIKDTFKGLLGIASPSRVFAEYGRATGEGYSRGVDESRPRAQDSIEAMAPAAPAGAGSSTTSARTSQAIAVTMHFHLEGVRPEQAQEVAKAVSAPSILRELTRAIREGLVTQGIPTQAPVQ